MGKITAEAIRIKLSQIIRDQMFELQWNGIKTETVDKIDNVQPILSNDFQYEGSGEYEFSAHIAFMVKEANNEYGTHRESYRISPCCNMSIKEMENNLERLNELQTNFYFIQSANLDIDIEEKEELIKTAVIEEKKSEEVKALEVETVKVETLDTKKDLNKLFEVKKKSLDDLSKKEENLLADEKPLDHVAILKKKMEAQKKLKENKDSVLDLNIVDNDNDLNEQIKKLEETISLLTDEMKQKDAIINQQDLEIKDKGDQIVILTNSIVSKTNEALLAKQLEDLKKENEELKKEIDIKVNELKEFEEKNSNETIVEVIEEKKENRVDINSPEIKEIIEQGDILLRIKLLNQRISEKDAKIQLVEDELNKLSEKDIVEMSFSQQIKALRETRRETVENANVHLHELTQQITNEENKLNARKEEFISKEKEMKAFDKSLSEQKLTYTEREEQMKIRSRMIAEYDSLAIKVDELEENFKKLVNRYKKILKVTEEKVDNFNKYENDLISLYLKQLRDAKSKNYKDYQENIEERNNLLVELDKLNNIYEEMKANNMFEIDDFNAEELAAMKKEYGKLMGKLNLIEVRYAERVNVEEVLRTIDPDVSNYLKAFEEREKLNFDINELNNKINEENQEHLELVINDYRTKVKYLDVVIAKNEDHEKVVFYKQLLKSMAEIKEKEAAIKTRVSELKVLIDNAESNE